ncbi:lytic transglycosylase domain-containing protein [Burkholderia sp. WSM2232]|uniref:lytic transglycosylase domain-containing protein n=1 Tax=Burkholderia sp. WSM2232 TaxID=944436 RepID=UPI0018DDD435|nr:lytic transglycosylase domain-containing protein [Burkholderia sp. WSM2232]
MSDGFFPLGVNGFPHGGVHFGSASSSRLDQSRGVQVIADGEIVAYRIDDTYPHLHYTQTRRWAWYSTGFVLVRHRMTMPRAPGSTAAQPADETLTFFSLYMHMADWSTYLLDGKLARPGWWPGVDAFRIGGKDTQTGGGTKGAFVYTAPKPGKKNKFTPGQHVGFLPEGSEVTIGETRGPWGHIRQITSGTMIAARAGDYFGWEDGPQAPWQLPDGVSEEATPGEAPMPGLATQTGTARTAEGDWGWIYLHDQQAVKEPTGVGTVMTHPQFEPIPVKAGTLLGQPGEYVDYETSTPLPPSPSRQLVHVEVFADETLKAFIDRSRARAAQLPPADRTIFVIPAGTRLVAKPADPDLTLGGTVSLARLTVTATSPKTGPWVHVQPWISGAPGHPQQYQSPVWIARSGLGALDSPNGLPAWKSFPLRLSQAASPVNADPVTYPRAQLNALGDGNIAIDDKGVTWWRLEVGTGAGQTGMGWVCGGKQSDGSGAHPGTHWESPWAWPGFEIVDATGINLTDAFRRNLSVTGSADPKEQKAFAPSTEAVGNSALLSRLEQTVSRLPSPNGTPEQPGKDGRVVVTAVKLRQALGRRWLASELGHVILKYESEWGGGMSRWEALTPLMRNAAENWKCELERIRKLQWWESVKGKVEGFPSSPVVNHIHPVGLVGNFSSSCTCINIDAFCAKYKALHATEFGWFDGHGRHININPLNEQSEHNLKMLLIEMMRQYPSTFSECKTSYLAYMLSTARVESYDWHNGIFFGPFTESISYADAEANYGCGPTATLTHKNRAISNENTSIGDGYKYRGRGLVQLTFKKAYRRFNGVAGTDLVQNPDKVLELPLAVQIMMCGMRDGTFSGARLSDFLDSETPDYVGARAIINGSDKASQFAFYAKKFEQLIDATR